MSTLFQDLRYALRQLGRDPASSLTAVISLALGIGAATAVFSVIYAALIDPYPYPTAGRIVRLTADTKSGNRVWLNLNGPQLDQVRQSPVIESIIAMDYHPMTLTGGEFPENVNVMGLVGAAYRDLGVAPLLGRGLEPSDAAGGSDPAPVALISYKFWLKHYFAGPTAVGKFVELDRKRYQIIGVAAPRFTWYVGDVYIPQRTTADPGPLFITNLLIKPGVSAETVDAALDPLLHRLAKDAAKQFPEHFRLHVEKLNAWVIREMSGTLYLLFAAVALLLAIGCGNVSILLLARGAARRQELAIRTALGARRARLIRQLLTESLTLALVGAAAGVAAAYGILAGIRLVLPPRAFAPEVVVRINLPVLLFSVAVATATGVLFGLLPALRLSQTRQAAASARRVIGGLHHRRTHGALIAGQVALTLLLLAAAGAAIAGFERLLHTPLGYDPKNVISVQMPLRDNAYTTPAARAVYFQRLLTNAAATPGVTSAAISSNATPPLNGWFTRFEIEGRPAPESQNASVNLISPAYFSTLRIPLIEGRLWTEPENHTFSRVAVVNRTFAQRYFPNGGAIGHAVRMPGIENRPPARLTVPDLAESWLTIVGVVADARNNGLRDPVEPAIYIPWTLSMAQGTQILVRSSEAPAALLNAVRKQLARVDPDQQTTGGPGDLESWISDLGEWQQQHLVAWIFGLFAALALLLAAVGLYSVVSWTVAQRTNELGIRMALGAPRSRLLWLVCTSAMAAVDVGLAAGLALTVATHRALSHWIAGAAADPTILAAGALLLAAVAALACIIPARRATSIDPATALRFE